MPETQPVPEADARILVVDDEDALADMVRMALEFVGFETVTAGTGADALSKCASFRPDLVVLDVMLPDIDGFDVCRLLRDRGDDVPVVFLTARDTDDDKLSGFGRGGDDYLTKPFSLDELVARIRAILRRAGFGAEGPNVIGYAGIEIDFDAHRVTRGGDAVALSATEFSLLVYLVQNAERVVSKMQILEHVWQYDFGGDAGVVETYISYLRKKIDDREPKLIHTVRGVGYMLRAE